MSGEIEGAGDVPLVEEMLRRSATRNFSSANTASPTTHRRPIHKRSDAIGAPAQMLIATVPLASI